MKPCAAVTSKQRVRKFTGNFTIQMWTVWLFRLECCKTLSFNTVHWPKVKEMRTTMDFHLFTQRVVRMLYGHRLELSMNRSWVCVVLLHNTSAMSCYIQCRPRVVVSVETMRQWFMAIDQTSLYFDTRPVNDAEPKQTSIGRAYDGSRCWLIMNYCCIVSSTFSVFFPLYSTRLVFDDCIVLFQIHRTRCCDLRAYSWRSI